MKRIVVLTALIAAGAVSYVVAQQGGQKPMVVEVQKLKDNLFVLTGGGGNTTVFVQADGITVGAYGAAAKGNTLLNFAGVRPDLLPYVVDKNPAKQDQYLPGSHIPVVSEAHLRAHQPQRILILPWNLRSEVADQLDYTRSWGAQMVVAVPRLEVF